MEAKPMDVKFFKDKLFDLLNDNDSMGISDIDTDDKNNIFTVETVDGSMFEIECRQLRQKEIENGGKRRAVYGKPNIYY